MTSLRFLLKLFAIPFAIAFVVGVLLVMLAFDLGAWAGAR